MIGKTTRAIEARAMADGFDLVAVTKGEGAKETLLGRVGGPQASADKEAEHVARALQHFTGHAWAYPGSDNVKGGV